MKKIGLIFGAVRGLMKLDTLRPLDTARIVARRKTRPTEATNMLETYAKLNLSVTEYVGVWSSTGPVLRQKIIEYPLTVLCRKVDSMKRNAQLTTDGQRVLVVGRNRAVGIVLFPISHEQAFDLEPLFSQPQGRDGRIDTARESDDDHLALPSTGDRDLVARPSLMEGGVFEVTDQR